MEKEAREPGEKSVGRGQTGAEELGLRLSLTNAY